MDSEHALPTVDTEPPPGVLRRAIAASAIGNATEWFDYGIYAYGCYIAAAASHEIPRTPSLLTLITFARLIPGPTAGRALLGPPRGQARPQTGARDDDPPDVRRHFLVRRPGPTYATIGLSAPIRLVLLRMVQGFSTGGRVRRRRDVHGRVRARRRRGFLGSFLEVGTLAGFTFGALLMLGFSRPLGDDAMQAWGWRLPFLVAAPLGLVGMYLRSKLEDTPCFRELAETGETEEHPTTVPGPTLATGGRICSSAAWSSRSTWRTTPCSATCRPTWRARSG